MQALADAAGCAKSYVSQVERGVRNPPSEQILRAWEKALRVPAGTLVDAACWQRGLAAGGATVRNALAQAAQRDAAVERLRATLEAKAARGEAGLSGAEVERLLAAFGGGAPVARGQASGASAKGGEGPPAVVARGAGGAAGVSARVLVGVPAEVPLINSVAAGYPREFTDLGYPARVADQYVRCVDVHDPDAFAARVVGDSMEPDYREGDVVVFSPARALKSGMDCFARLEPDHDSTFKRVYFERGADGAELIRLQPLNSKYPPRTLPREQVAGLYAAVTVMRTLVAEGDRG